MNLLNTINQNKPKEFVPSKFQSNIFDFITSVNGGNGICNAVAGSGKTTTIVEGLKLIPKKATALFAAFNKSIVEELKNRVPQEVDVQTLHSIGLMACKVAYGMRIKVDFRKYNNYIKTIARAWELTDDDNPSEYKKKILKLCDLIRQNVCDDKAELMNIAVRNGVLISDTVDLDRAFELVNICSNDTRSVDFTDMLYLPVKHNLEMVATYDWVFVDECQDLNRSQQELLKKLVKKEGRWLAVGDSKQAIYGFAGADVESYDRLKKMANIELPLSVSYRCSKSVVRFAQTIVPDILPFENAPEGQVNHKGKISDIKDGDFVLCRNTAPLVDLCLTFIGKGRKAYIIGSDIGKGLITMIEDTTTSLVDDMYDELAKSEQELLESLWQKGYNTEDALDSEVMQRFKEKVSILKVISRANQYTKTSDMIRKIEEIFHSDESKSGVIFSTIHKAKGLEAETVHIIEKRLMPNPKATKDWEIEQERNLIYVAYTRAKLNLNFVEDYKFI